MTDATVVSMRDSRRSEIYRMGYDSGIKGLGILDEDCEAELLASYRRGFEDGQAARRARETR